MNDPMVHEIDLKENAVYIVKAGSITQLLPMEHGTDEIIWNKSNMDVVRTHRVRLNGDKIISENP